MTISDSRKLVEIENPWGGEPGVVRVRRSPDEPAEVALALRADREGLARPYIFDTPFERRLHFSQEATQSAMSLADPDVLLAAYTRKMMAFLLLNPDPQHIVMLGLGGGSLAKFCYRHLPKSRITVVEINADVIALRDEFLIPADDERFRVVLDDGARFVASLHEPIDALLVDAFDEDGVAASLADPRFYASAARLLGKHGVLVMNLWGQRERYVVNLRHAVAEFGKHALLLTVLGELNLLLFASRRAPPTSITADLETAANSLQRTLQLDFPRYLRRLCQGNVLA